MSLNTSRFYKSLFHQIKIKKSQQFAIILSFVINYSRSAVLCQNFVKYSDAYTTEWRHCIVIKKYYIFMWVYLASMHVDLEDSFSLLFLNDDQMEQPMKLIMYD